MKYHNSASLPALAAAVLLAGPAFAHQTPSTDAPAATRPAEGQLPSATQVIDKFVEATGGRDAYERFKSQKATGRIEVPAFNLAGTIELYQKAPSRMLVVADLAGFGKVESGTDGKIAWQIEPMNGPNLADEKETQKAVRQADPQAPIKPQDYYSDMEVKGVEDVDDKPAYHLVLTPKDGTGAIDFYYDVQTGLLLKTTQTEKTLMGESRAENLYEDYRDVGEGDVKIKLPFKLTIRSDGIEKVVTLKDVTMNPDIPDSRFDAPEAIKDLAKDTGKGRRM